MHARKRYLYSIKSKAMNLLFKQKLFYTTMSYTQKINEKENTLYVGRVEGNNKDIYSLQCFRKKGTEIQYKGTIGIIKHEEITSELSVNDAVSILKNYINSKVLDKGKTSSFEKNNIIKKSNSKAKEDKKYKVKETKLVEIERLRVVKDIHLNGNLNPNTTEIKRKQLIEKINNNNSIYPKDEAILVYKARDPKDKRKIVYNIEDGYRRYRLSSEFNLEKVYVDIIEEEIN